MRLDPGQTERVKLELSDRDFAFYSVAAKHWVVEPGAFTLMVGTSSTNIAFTGSVRCSNSLLIPV